MTRRLARHALSLFLLAPLALACASSANDAMTETTTPRLSSDGTETVPSEQATQPEETGLTYTVKSGDTLIGIAARYGVSLAELTAANPSVGPDTLQIGDTIMVPGSTGPVTVPPPNENPTSAPQLRPGVVAGLRMPMEGACLPSSYNLLPNAPRAYRFGVHEGVDYYPGQSCTTVGLGTPVVASRGGTVTVATLDYHDLTQSEWDAILGRAREAGTTLENDLFVLRGRQIEIDHGGGLRTRYAHLSDIADGVAAGARVEAGQVVGYVGNSGTPSSIGNPSAEHHLHFEIRVGATFLAAGLSSEEVVRLYEQAFSQ